MWEPDQAPHQGAGGHGEGLALLPQAQRTGRLALLWARRCPHRRPAGSGSSCSRSTWDPTGHRGVGRGIPRGSAGRRA